MLSLSIFFSVTLPKNDAELQLKVFKGFSFLFWSKLIYETTILLLLRFYIKLSRSLFFKFPIFYSIWSSRSIISIFLTWLTDFSAFSLGNSTSSAYLTFLICSVNSILTYSCWLCNFKFLSLNYSAIYSKFVCIYFWAWRCWQIACFTDGIGLIIFSLNYFVLMKSKNAVSDSTCKVCVLFGRPRIISSSPPTSKSSI